MKTRIIRISPGSLAALLGVGYFVAGCLMTVMTFLGACTGLTLEIKGPLSFSGSSSSLATVLLYPFFLALMGIVSGLITAWIFNFAVGFTKGLLIYTRDECGLHPG
ncbi:MAG TPA: hypothetical protein VMN36_10325 [Verrucomicrobiales bacterium]|nr:hypothetical protein [Verrucomicrobiales bacterium]